MQAMAAESSCYAREFRCFSSRTNVISGCVIQVFETDYHIRDLVNQMKTTLNIDDQLMAKVKQEAARQGRTMSEFIESALRVALQATRKQQRNMALPTFRGGVFRVNVADNDALHDFMEGR